MRAPEGSDSPGVPTARRALGAATSIFWVLGALALGWLLWPSSLGGCTTLTIVSGHSMEPTYYTGDLVVSRCGPVEVGDVIVYSPPDVGGARVIHRIVDGDAGDGWIVQGDNNDFLDPWTPTADDILGSSVLHLPQVGKVAAILLSPMTWLSLLVVALAVVVWPGTPDDENDDDADDPDAASGGDDATRVPDDEAGRTSDDGATAPGVPGRRLVGRALMAAALMLPLGTGAGIAHAAVLNVHPASLSTFTVGHPCTGTMTATTPTTSGTTTAVDLTAPTGCAGLPLAITLTSGAEVRHGAAIAPASGSVRVTFDESYTPSTSVAVAATVAHWHLPTTWSYTPAVVEPPTAGPVTPGTDWTDIRSLTWPTVNVGQQFCFDVTVSTTNRNGQEDWALNLNIAQRPFNGAVSGYQILGADAGKVAFTSTVPSDGVLKIVGTGSYKKLRSSDPALSFSVCHWGTPAPAYDPALSYSVNQGPVVGGPNAACVTTEVRVTGTPVFYAGWRADIDMSAAIALASSPGNTFSGVYAQNDGFTIEVRPGNVYRVSGAHWGNYGLRDGMTRTVVLCAN